MVGRMLLFKMLHCRRVRQRQAEAAMSEDAAEESSDSSTNLLTIKNEMQHEIAEQNFTCRVCMKHGTIPIFGDDTYEDISNALESFAEIRISAIDSYPKFLCHECHSLLEGAILFRKTAQETDKALKNPKTEVPIDNYDDEMFNYDDEPDFDTPEVTNQSFDCTICNINFHSLKDLKEHRKTSEHKDGRHTCPICNKEYGTQYFKKHLLVHESETPYICDVCGKGFTNRSHFTRHHLTHGFDLPFQCPHCPYRGRFRESLKAHMRTHTGERNYQCSECPTRCVNKGNLNRHMLTHRKDFDYRCDSCGKGFYTRRELELHFKVDHTGIKDHVCDICGKAFGYRKHMMKHQLKVHKRDKLRSGRMPLYLVVEEKKLKGELE